MASEPKLSKGSLMSTRRARHNRDWILLKYNEAPDTNITLTGYLNYVPKTNWITFTQVENELGERISGHINLPQKKVHQLFPNIQDHNHTPFILKGKPSFYTSKGTKRGALLIETIVLKEG